MNAYMNQYQQNQIMTASQEQILLMLYDGAIRFCRQAMTASEAGNTPEKIGRIAKVYAIVAEFSNSLDHKIGGNIADDLDGLYSFIMRELNKARTDTSGKHLQDVEKLLLDLRGTWAEAILVNQQEQALLQTARQDQLQSQQPSKRLSAAG